MGPDDIRELFAAFGPVAVRRMFGGAGVFVDGIMIALVHESLIYLKVDAESSAPFDAEGLAPFSYRRSGATASLPSYRRMPDRLYDDPEELARWARHAFAAACRSSGAKRKSRSARPRRMHRA